MLVLAWSNIPKYLIQMSSRLDFQPLFRENEPAVKTGPENTAEIEPKCRVSLLKTVFWRCLRKQVSMKLERSELIFLSLDVTSGILFNEYIL